MLHLLKCALLGCGTANMQCTKEKKSIFPNKEYINRDPTWIIFARETQRPSYTQLFMVPKQFLLLPVPASCVVSIPEHSQNLEPNHSADFVSLLKFWTTTWSLGICKNLSSSLSWRKGGWDGMGR